MSRKLEMTVPFNLALVGPYREHVSRSGLHTWVGGTMTSTVHSNKGGPGIDPSWELGSLCASNCRESPEKKPPRHNSRGPAVKITETF